MRLPFLSRDNSTPANSTPAKSPWPWPSCHQPRTLSFRNSNRASAYLYDADTPESWFTNSSESPSFSCISSDEINSGGGDCTIETLIRSVRSERLFFEPASQTKSLVEEPTNSDDDGESSSSSPPFKESVILSMESKDPFGDFRKSMEEMVESHGLRDWENLEELLGWYLKANGKSNHGYIVGAFVDLLVGLAVASESEGTDEIITAYCSCSCSCPISVSPSSPLSFYTYSNSSEDSSVSPCVSSMSQVAEEIGRDRDGHYDGDDDDASYSSSSF